MTIELFLLVVFQVSIAAAFTALCTAGVAVVIYYSYKTAETLIQRRTKIIGKVKKSRWLTKDTPAIRMVKSERNGKKMVAK